MRTATELLAEMLAIHSDPQQGAAELHSWLHQAVEEVKGVVEGEQDEVGRLRGFFEHLSLTVWEFCDIDGGEFQDRAVEQGLLVSVPADEQFKAEYDCDEMYTWSWSPLAIDRARGEGE